MIQNDDNEDDKKPADDVFESEDGDRLTRERIFRLGWKEGVVEQDGDAFVVSGVRYSPVDEAD